MTLPYIITDIDSKCSEFDNGTALHIAASNLAHEAVKVLLQNGASAQIKDDMGRTPIGKGIYDLKFLLISNNTRVNALSQK